MIACIMLHGPSRYASCFLLYTLSLFAVLVYADPYNHSKMNNDVIERVTKTPHLAKSPGRKDYNERITAMDGKSVTLQCNLPGTDGLRVRWIDWVYNVNRKPSIIFDSNQKLIDPAHPNAHNFDINPESSALTINNVKVKKIINGVESYGDSGEYVCIAGEDGFENDYRIQLDISDHPECQAIVDPNKELSCSARFSGETVPKLAIFKNDEFVESHSSIVIGYIQNNITLEEVNLDADRLTCRLTFGDEKHNCSFNLMAWSQPVQDRHSDGHSNQNFWKATTFVFIAVSIIASGIIAIVLYYFARFVKNHRRRNPATVNNISFDKNEPLPSLTSHTSDMQPLNVSSVPFRPIDVIEPPSSGFMCSPETARLVSSTDEAIQTDIQEQIIYYVPRHQTNSRAERQQTTSTHIIPSQTSSSSECTPQDNRNIISSHVNTIRWSRCEYPTTQLENSKDTFFKPMREQAVLNEAVNDTEMKVPIIPNTNISPSESIENTALSNTNLVFNNYYDSSTVLNGSNGPFCLDDQGTLRPEGVAACKNQPEELYSAIQSPYSQASTDPIRLDLSFESHSNASSSNTAHLDTSNLNVYTRGTTVVRHPKERRLAEGTLCLPESDINGASSQQVVESGFHTDYRHLYDNDSADERCHGGGDSFGDDNCFMSVLQSDQNHDSNVINEAKTQTEDCNTETMYSALESNGDSSYMNRDDLHLAHIANNPIYEQLQSIPWVMGYSSTGQTIEVYADLQNRNERELYCQLESATGQPDSKFLLKQTERDDSSE